MSDGYGMIWRIIFADTAGFHCVELAGVYCTDWRDWPVWLAFLAGLQKI